MNTLMKGNSPLGMIYNQSAENIAYDSNNSVKDKIDDLDMNYDVLVAERTVAGGDVFNIPNFTDYRFIFVKIMGDLNNGLTSLIPVAIAKIPYSTTQVGFPLTLYSTYGSPTITGGGYSVCFQGYIRNDNNVLNVNVGYVKVNQWTGCKFSAYGIK